MCFSSISRKGTSSLRSQSVLVFGRRLFGINGATGGIVGNVEDIVPGSVKIKAVIVDFEVDILFLNARKLNFDLQFLMFDVGIYPNRRAHLDSLLITHLPSLLTKR
jgi:hypothetical protein